MTAESTSNVVQASRPSSHVEELHTLAQRARWEVIKTVDKAKAGHIGGPLSMMDLLVTLYFQELRIRPEEPSWPDRDRFVLSKGHAALGLYAVLALRGYFDLDELATFDQGDSRLQGHPDVTRLPGLDASTGSLGQGLSFGVGLALGARLNGQDFHTWVLLGDGEIQEGMVWEAAQAAIRYRLTNLTAILDRNGLQQFGLPSDDLSDPTDRGNRRDPWSGVDVGAVFAAFGWRVLEFDGHDYDAIAGAYQQARVPDPDGRPTVLVAQTVKGKGLSLAEGVFTWHSTVPTTEQVHQARAELVPDLAEHPVGVSGAPEIVESGDSLRLDGGRL
jgi:transketolase